MNVLVYIETNQYSYVLQCDITCLRHAHTYPMVKKVWLIYVTMCIYTGIKVSSLRRYVAIDTHNL